MPWLLVLQVILLLGWYGLPALAAMPWWLVFAPLMVVGVSWVLLLIIFAICGAVAIWTAKK